VTAQRDDPAARPTDVPEQLLDDRGRADVLDADRVLRPADGVTERACLLAAGVTRECFGHVNEVVDAAPAHIGDELGRVALIVPLQDLEDAARVMERLVFGRRLAM
jgi:hypothetical protein